MAHKPGDYCEHCQNTGYVDCLCGGDLCICMNNGEKECPHCSGGFMGDEFEENDDG